MKLRILRVLCLAGLLHILTPGASQAATVTLAWDSNTEPDLAGYQILYGTSSGQYSSMVDVGNHTMYQVTNLEDNRAYFFAVRAYNRAGIQSALSSEVSTGFVSGGELSLNNFSASAPSPKLLGTPITFYAGPSGGKPPYQYKWFISDGTIETVVRNWSGDSTYTWNPLVPGANYIVKLWVRNSGSTIDAPENGASARTMPFTIIANGGTATMTSLSADATSPQVIGSPITFSATASSGTPPYQFRWLVFNGSSWRVVRSWATGNTFLWRPSAPNANYIIRAQVRSANNGADAPDNPSAERSFPFEIKAFEDATAITLTSDRDSPQRAGTTINFSAAASGVGSAYYFQWSVFDGASWSTVKGWSSDTQFSWTPTSANNGYKVRVEVRGGKNIGSDASLALLYPIVP